MLPRLLVILASCSLALAAAAAETSPEFQILGADGRPMANARIMLLGRIEPVSVDGDGHFRLIPFPELPVELLIMDGAGRLAGTVLLEAIVPVDGPVVLTLNPVGLEAVTVVLGSSPSTASSPAAAATMMTREELDRARPSRLVDTLAAVPGAENSGSGQTAAPTIRGLSRGRTLVLLDGARVTTERRAGASATFLDPFSLESTELVRGPGSVAYGSDALGGILHARTVRPVPGEFAGRWELAAGGGVPYGSAAFGVNLPAGEQGSFLVQGHQRSFDDYETPDGTEENSSARDRGFLVRGRMPWLSGDLNLGFQFDEAIDVERPASNTGTSRTDYPLERSERLTLDWTRTGLSGWFKEQTVQLFLGRYRLETEREDDEPGGVEISGSDVSASDYSIRVAGMREREGYRLQAGLDLNGRAGLEAVGSIDSAQRTDAGLYMEGERFLDGGRWTVSGGARLDQVRSSNSGGNFGDRTSSNGTASGFAAIGLRPWESATRFTFQVARGFRDPSLSDRYFSGTTARGRITGNPDLSPETSLQFDLSATTRVGRTTVAAYGYHYTVSDLIERFETAEDEFGFRNRDEVVIRGLELEADTVLAEGWTLRTIAGRSEGELEDGSRPNDIPAATVGATVQHSASDRLWYRFGGRYVFRDEDAGSTEQLVPGYAVLDMVVGWEAKTGWSARLVLKNLADRNHLASADRRAPSAPGLSAALVVSGRF
ncbi:MAG: TonB-dependent receptor [Acidobacteria bacterium]|uniref:TonB-dependent receptor n=1 Tax=Candidatus Polarisedimenticola svalbardensis TaxID=2886004 RepID=A0A8J6XWB8_9BACT|nr:TonB-dependent receptor [Candidatus Polarisedimenticola svalbardensis]